MSTPHAHNLVQTGADRLPRHPSPHHTALARRLPSPLAEAWLRAPAATVFRRRDLSRVETSGVGHNFFVHEPRSNWQQAYIEVNDDVASLRHARRPLAPLELDVDALSGAFFPPTNRTPHLPLLDNSLAEYEPGERSSRVSALSGCALVRS